MNIKYLLFIMILFLFFSCGVIKYGNNTDSTPPVPIVTYNWINDPYNPGYYQFRTNDPAMTSDKGYSYWFINNFTNTSASTYEINVFKSSGCSDYGYGIVFCIQDSTDDPADTGDNTSDRRNFYTVLVRNDGCFQILKIVNKEQYKVAIEGSDGNGWKKPVDEYNNCILNTGAGVINTIKVVYTGKDTNNNSCYDLYFNDYPEKIFTITDGVTVTIGKDNKPVTLKKFDGDQNKDKYGVIVTLAPNNNIPGVGECFPAVPVIVEFMPLMTRI